MASNYNTRLRPAELLVDGTEHTVIRRHEIFDDLVATTLFAEDNR